MNNNRQTWAKHQLETINSILGDSIPQEKMPPIRASSERWVNDIRADERTHIASSIRIWAEHESSPVKEIFLAIAKRIEQLPPPHTEPPAYI